MADYVQLGVNSIKDLFTWLTERSKSKDIIKNDLLREFRDNLKLLEHRDKEQVNLLALIDKVRLSSIENAYLKNYNFNKLSEGKKLTSATLLNKRQEKYVGWDVKRFIYSIEGKIKDLKNLPVLYTDLQSAPINMNVRLDNLYYQLLLLVIFISTSEIKS